MPGMLDKSECDRCRGDLPVRIMSWFTTETLCMGCSDVEKAIKEKLRAQGMDPRTYEGCGYVPQA